MDALPDVDGHPALLVDHDLQLELPLRPRTGDEGRPASGHVDAEWRLDEETRQVGRRGVAAARAALAGTGPVHGRDRASAPRPRSAGRAA